MLLLSTGLHIRSLYSFMWQSFKIEQTQIADTALNSSKTFCIAAVHVKQKSVFNNYAYRCGLKRVLQDAHELLSFSFEKLHSTLIDFNQGS